MQRESFSIMKNFDWTRKMTFSGVVQFLIDISLWNGRETMSWVISTHRMRNMPWLGNDYELHFGRIIEDDFRNEWRIKEINCCPEVC